MMEILLQPAGFLFAELEIYSDAEFTIYQHSAAGVGNWRFLFKVDGAFIACLHLSGSIKNMAVEAQNIFTRPEHRRNGIAGRLMQKADQHFKEIWISDNRSCMGQEFAEHAINDLNLKNTFAL